MRRSLKILGWGFLVLVVLIVLAAVLAPSEPPSVAENPPNDQPAKVKEPRDPKDPQVVVRITGDPGQRFTGDIGTLDRSRSVQGITPQEFKVRGVDTGFASMDSVTVVASKESQGNEVLKTEIIVDGKVVKNASTRAAYGVTTLNWSPAE